MAKLSSFKVDSQAIADGQWVRVGEEFDDLEIHTRGLTDAYFDAQAAKQRQAAVSMNGDVEKLPQAVKRAINIQCLKAHVLLPSPEGMLVRNLQNDDGTAVSNEQFLDMLSDPDCRPLLSACFSAAARVGQRRQADQEEAAKN